MGPVVALAVLLPAVLMPMVGCVREPAPWQPDVSSSTSSTADAVTVDPGNIRRVGREFPPGYEVTNIARADSPAALWGLGAGAVSNPSQCMTLAAPAAGDDRSAQGVSGSGAGGILDAVVVSSPGGSLRLDGAAVVGCPHWDLTAGRTVVAVGLTDAPLIDGADTLGMVADIRAAVEAGSEIDSRAYTFVAYLGDHYVFTMLTVDPGSILPSLPPRFAADLLVETVSMLRG